MIFHSANQQPPSQGSLPLTRESVTHLLLGLQALRVDPPHVVGFRTDVVVPVVFDEVHAGIVCGLCGSHCSQVG